MANKKRIRLVVAYDGSDFCGWAPQRGQRTVHGILTEAVRQVSGEDCEIIGASRTDSGASAKGQVCHFDTSNPMPIERWKRTLNRVLPSDLAVVRATRAPREFHSRFWAQDRWYRYRVLTGDRDPLRARCAHHEGRPLDVERMQRAAQSLVGKHDFIAFSQLIPRGANTVRELFSVDVKRVRDEIWIDVVGTAFVRGMMRRISGALLEVGLGTKEPESIAALLEARDKRRIKWPTLLPANGLTLMRVRYGRKPHDRRLAQPDETDE